MAFFRTVPFLVSVAAFAASSVVHAETSVSASQVPPVKVSGFVDAQYQYANPVSGQGFLIQDGALYLTQEGERFDFKIDIPFKMDLASRSGQNSNIVLGNNRAQAFVNYHSPSGFRGKVGQFDTIFGMEANDTVDIPFTVQGNVYNAMDPVVHTGLLLSYDVAPVFTVNGIYANPADKGTMTKENPQYGLQLAYASQVRATAGFLLNRVYGSSDTKKYFCMTLGSTFGALAIDFEGAFRKDTTSLGVAQGYSSQWIYGLSDQASFGVRGEWLKNLGVNNSATALKDQKVLFVGPQFKLSDAVKFKLDYSFQYDKDLALAIDQKSHGVRAALVYRIL